MQYKVLLFLSNLLHFPYDGDGKESEKVDSCNLPEKLKIYRQVNEYTQEYCAELCNISHRYWRKLEHGQATPSIDTVFKLMNGLHLSIEQLFDKNAIIMRNPEHPKNNK